MKQTCRNCQEGFDILAQDKSFYERIGVPSPTLCPTCRQQLRAAHRNESHLYYGKCAKTGKSVLTMYRPESKAVYYAPDVWWSDQWEPMDYGRDYDFSRPFFEQFADLQAKVPRLALYSKQCENSDFSNHVHATKNVYLCASIDSSEDIYYSKWIITSRDLVDCYHLKNGEQCYETVYSSGTHNTKFCTLTDDCSDSDFLYNCKNVRNSLMCWNLRNKQYHIKNQPYSKAEYEHLLKQYDTGSYGKLLNYMAEYDKLKLHALRKPTEQTNCEECSGDFLTNCKNVHDSYSTIEAWDSGYCYDSVGLKDCYDVYVAGFDCELEYACHGCDRAKFLIGCSISYDIDNSYYCQMCHNSSNLFGCIGLRHKKYCIFNKQYSKEEYERLVPKIIENMKRAGEWGEFFPMELSFFAYNESEAPEFAPMSKEQVLAKGWQWYEPKREFQPQTYTIPDHIRDVPDSITKEVLVCGSCGRNYKIIPQELSFYRKHNLPVPRKCHACRYEQRLKSRNPYRLYSRKCQKCSADIRTTYAPNKPETIYCEQCYLKEVY